MDELKLAHEHLVFKWSSLDPDIKCSEVGASINVNKVTPEVITQITELLQDIMPELGLECCLATSDAAGCNWVAFKDIMSTHTYRDVLPESITEKYPDIDFDIMCVNQNPVTKEFFIFLPDMCHLTKNIVTALELSSSKTSKRNLKYGRCPLNMKMIEVVWIETDGPTGQMHTTKLTILHFDKNAHSRMNVSLATQLLSASVATMIREAIADLEITLPFRNRDVYNHLADLCDKWNEVVDICNGKDGDHTPDNAVERQQKLLDTLSWFSGWKKLHDERVAKGEADEYNFFANETWFCIKSLLLGHVATIQLYCIEKGESIRPRSMNTDCVEWFFADARQMVAGSTNKLTARTANHAGKKSNAFNAAKCNLAGNNATGESNFGRSKRY